MYKGKVKEWTAFSRPWCSWI